MSNSVFSKRHARALRDKTIEVRFSRIVRGRIRKTMELYSESYWYQPDPSDNWRAQTTTVEQTELALRRLQGVDILVAFNYEERARVPTDFAGFMDGALPAEVCDALELFVAELSETSRTAFRKDINQILVEEGTEWRLLDEIVVKLDTSILDSGIVDHTVDVLKAMELEGALEEFRDALSELTGGDPRDAIQDACNAFESVLKGITGGTGNASRLLDQLLEGQHLSDLPEDGRRVVKRTLQALPILGNALGRHGQGPDVIDVHPRYAQLAVHLCGASIIFLLDAHTEAKPQRQEVSNEWGPDEAPF